MANAAVVGPIDLEFEVHDIVDDPQPMRIASWLFVPVKAPRTVSRLVVLLPGGSYDKRYYHLEVPGRGAYSMASFLAARGNAVLALDHLGVGGSTHPKDLTVVTPEAVAALNHAVSVQAGKMFAAGSLHPALQPVDAPTLVGVGHSMGGMLAILQQAAHRSYERLAVLGKSTLVLSESDRASRAKAVQLTVKDGYAHPTRDRSLFYSDDVPDDVIGADLQVQVPVPALLAAGTFASEAMAQAASAIEVPVFLAAGERDTVADIRREPAAYVGSDDITTFVLRGSGHCHNLASTREVLWGRLSRWIAAEDCGYLVTETSAAEPAGSSLRTVPA